MQKKRFDLPPIDLIESFEAAGRTLSFTKAADELHLTQSAVSRQIKQLEDRIGVPLFERHHRALALTEEGERLLATSASVLEQLQGTVDQLRASRQQRQISLTTTPGFASFWLIPRLKRFTSDNPDVDVRISATNTNINLDRSNVDLAIRYATQEASPPGATPLFGEEITPVCSPSLITGATPLKSGSDLRHHTLLHQDYAVMEKTWFDWDTWLTSFGVPDLKPAAAIHFTQYDQVIQAAVAGQGVALGRLPLINDLIRSGALVAPFAKQVSGTRGYMVIRSPSAAKKAHVTAFCDWLFAEARRDEAGAAPLSPKLAKKPRA